MAPNKGDPLSNSGKIHNEKDLDISLAHCTLWLVKIPKYIAKKWDNAPNDMIVGKIRLEKRRQRKPIVLMTLTPEIQQLEPVDKQIPLQHTLHADPVLRQTLAVFSQDGISNRMVGRVIHKMDCSAVAVESYLDMKVEAIRKAALPRRKVQILERVVNNFKPISDHKNNIEYKRRKKAKFKWVRYAKNVVVDILFRAFEKHQFYNIKDLVKITKQPISYLKEILREYCDYNVKSPHKNMWELKKEYRHYSSH